MPLLEQGEPIADSWIAIDDSTPLPAGQGVISLARFLADRPNGPVGVRIGAATTLLNGTLTFQNITGGSGSLGVLTTTNYGINVTFVPDAQRTRQRIGRAGSME